MWKLAAMLHLVTGTVLSGMLVAVIVAVPSLYDQGMKLIPWAVLAGMVAAVPVSLWAAKAILAQSRQGASKI
ncbi:MAG: hypothetical protein ACRCXM_06225 [Beijerinckiaceae bacterium]